MNLKPAENRELTLAESINQRNPKPGQKPGTGHYLALTFGTLLSSQRADAQQVHPLGLPCWLDVQHYAGFQRFPIRGAGPADLGGPRGAWRTIHALEGVVHGGPEWSRTRRSGDPARPELDADAGTDRLRRLRDAVLPGALAGATHDDQVTVSERELEAVPASHRSQHQRTG